MHVCQCAPLFETLALLACSSAVMVVQFDTVTGPLNDRFDHSTFLMILQTSVQCVDNPDGFGGVVVNGNITYPISFHQVRSLPDILNCTFKTELQIWFSAIYPSL